MQINQDVLDTISFAIDQLQVSEIPDLFCAYAEEWNEILLTPENFRSLHIQLFGSTEYDDTTTRVGGLSNLLNLAENVSIHRQVLQFLTLDTEYEWDVENNLVTRIFLEVCTTPAAVAAAVAPAEPAAATPPPRRPPPPRPSPPWSPPPRPPPPRKRAAVAATRSRFGLRTQNSNQHILYGCRVGNSK